MICYFVDYNEVFSLSEIAFNIVLLRARIKDFLYDTACAAIRLPAGQ